MLICLNNKKLKAFFPLFIAAAFNNSLYLSELGMNVSLLYNSETFENKILGVEGVFLCLGIGSLVALGVFRHYLDKYQANALKILYANMIIGAFLHIFAKSAHNYYGYLALGVSYGFSEIGS
mmetsp:Transcript_29351/g.26819  ORF Transcript_29351/g.26819 Transcript_29351/m.26819 type:complete len:122 (+) Transcript_29351:472-837(+)